MKPDSKELIAKYRLLEIDHDPDGWPAIRMSDITALCDEIERLTPAFEIGEIVKVIADKRKHEGMITSVIINVNNGTRYQVSVQSSTRDFLLWFPESQVYKL